jgi:glutathione S-transferase
MSHAIILHHFDQSPFSEKIRVIFGFKQLAWKSVRTSRVMPRPNLMPLTGGYRRTPTLQIGADIYCDTQIIIRELERRFPNPGLLPADAAGISFALAMWSDRTFFQSTVGLVFGLLADRVPREFIEDRGRLRGAPFDVAAMTTALPQSRDQFRGHVSWIEAQLDEREWLLGAFSLADIHAYMNIWYVRSSLANADDLLAPFPRTRAWEQRVRAIGHGTRSEMSDTEALAIAAEASPQSQKFGDPGDPSGRKPGDLASVIPDDYGKVPVKGEIVSLSAQHIAIRRRDDKAGEIVVHFPRVGFNVLNA